MSTRPRLVYFRRTRADLPEFLRLHLQYHVRCLAQYFEVTLLDSESSYDFDQVCDVHKPDLAVFECGVDTAGLDITNAHTHPRVARIGFMHMDAFDSLRAQFLRDMERWHVSTFFSHSVSIGEYTPEIADDLYYWPNFVVPDTFHDFGEPKVLPVLVTGSQAPMYPWRNRVTPLLQRNFATMTIPHPGWRQAGSARPPLMGEAYARLINMSQFVPACGSISKDVVRKHLEVPAARSCLVSEPSAALSSAGFVDMVNCVLTDGADVVDRLDYLMSHPEVLEQITESGYDLVHDHHTMAHRSQIKEWFDLRQDLRAGQRIVQDGPFGGMRVEGDDRPRVSTNVVGDGVDRIVVAEGWRLLQQGSVASARRAFLRALTYGFIPDAVVGMTMASAKSGDPSTARRWIDRLAAPGGFQRSLSDLDPVVAAALLLVLLCSGDVAGAKRLTRGLPGRLHPELERVVRVVDIVGGAPVRPRSCSEGEVARASMISMPPVNVDAWLATTAATLRACGQETLACLVGTQQVSGPEAWKSMRRQVGRMASGDEARARATKVARRVLTATSHKVTTGAARLALRDGFGEWLDQACATEALRVIRYVGAFGLDPRLALVARAAARNPLSPVVVSERTSLQRSRLAPAPDAVLGGHMSGQMVVLDRRAVMSWTSVPGLFESSILAFVASTTEEGHDLMDKLGDESSFELVASFPSVADGALVFRARSPAPNLRRRENGVPRVSRDGAVTLEESRW